MHYYVKSLKITRANASSLILIPQKNGSHEMTPFVRFHKVKSRLHFQGYRPWDRTFDFYIHTVGSIQPLVVRGTTNDFKE